MKYFKSQKAGVSRTLSTFAAFLFAAAFFFSVNFCGGASKELVEAVTDSDFQKEVIESKKPVLVDFWATWCGPCRIYGPTVDKVAKDYAGRLKVVRVDIDQNPKLARSFQIQAIPASFIIKNGKVVNSWVGLVSEDEVKANVKQVVKAIAKKRPNPTTSVTPSKTATPSKMAIPTKKVTPTKTTTLTKSVTPTKTTTPKKTATPSR